MSKSRREFLTEMSMGLLSVSAGFQVQDQKPPNPPPGAPPAFGTSPPVGPEVSPGTFAEAEKLMRVEMTASGRDEAAGNWRKSMAALYERRTEADRTLDSFLLVLWAATLFRRKLE